MRARGSRVGLPARAALALAVVVGAAGLAGCGEDPVPGLEARKAEILATTVPKDEFWEVVGRKGKALGEVRKLSAESEAIGKRAQAFEEANATRRESLARAREVNARTEDVLGDVERSQGELHAEVEKLQALIARWDAPPPDAAPDAAPEAAP